MIHFCSGRKSQKTTILRGRSQRTRQLKLITARPVLSHKARKSLDSTRKKRQSQNRQKYLNILRISDDGKMLIVVHCFMNESMTDSV